MQVLTTNRQQNPKPLLQKIATSLSKTLQTFVDTWKRVFLQAHALHPPPGSPPPLPVREWKEWVAGSSSVGGGGGISSSGLCICSFNLLSDDCNEQYSFQFVSPNPSFGNFTLWDYRLPRCVAGSPPPSHSAFLQRHL
jgi:hypothetical protein